MGIRHLTSIELFRLTEQKDIAAQVQSLDDQRLPYTLRRVGNCRKGLVIGINIYDCDVRGLLSADEWNAIVDRSIGTGFRLTALDRLKAA